MYLPKVPLQACYCFRFVVSNKPDRITGFDILCRVLYNETGLLV